MDIYLRSYARARNQHKKRHRGETVRPTRDPGSVSSLFRGAARATEGRPDLALTNCSLLGRQGRFTITLREGVIQGVQAAADGVQAQRVVDVGEGLVLPGFTDSHVHLLPGAERLSGCDLEDVREQDELWRRLREFAEHHPEQPVVRAYGLNYLDPPLLDPDRTREQLDRCVTDRPLMILAHDLHTMWVNSRALEQSDLLVTMPPYPRELEQLGAQEGLVLGSDGVPTGELREPECYYLVEGALGSRYPVRPERKLEALKRAVARLNALGITSVHNMGLAMPEEDVELLMLLLELEQMGELNLRVESSYSVVPDESMLEDVQNAAEIRDGLRSYRAGSINTAGMHGFLGKRLAALEASRRYEAQKVEGSSAHDQVRANHVRVHLERLEQRLQEIEPDRSSPDEMVTMEAVKVFLDGVVEKNTAYRTDRQPQPGIPTFQVDDLKATVALADRLGLQVRAHCIGDGAVGMMLDAVAGARRANAARDAERGHRVRHRVEHIEMSRPEDLPRFADEDVVPSMQPFHERPPTTMWHTLVPESRWDTAFPWRSLTELGTQPVFGSDWPIVSCDCLEAARHAATRTPWRPELPDQGLSIEQALESFTSLPPRAVHREDRLGAIEPGMLADLVVLTPGPLLSQDGARVGLTICAGRIVYEASDKGE